MANETSSSSESRTTSSLSQFFTALIPAALMASVQLTIFILIRRRFRRIYEPKTYIGKQSQQVKPLPKGPFNWIFTIFRMPREDLIRVSGLDAYFFARYIYLHILFFLTSFVILAIILFPVYAVRGKGHGYNRTGLDLLTYGNISPYSSSRYGAPLVLAYFFILTYIYILYRELKIFIEKRQTLLRSSAYQTSDNAKTILLMSIPIAHMSENILLTMFNRFPGGVKSIWLNRNIDTLQKLVDKRQKFVNKLETTHCKYVKKSLKKGVDRVQRPTTRIGSIPILSSLCLGKKVDAIDFYKDQIAQLNTDIDQQKARIDQNELYTSAFIQFHEPIAAHMAMQCSLGSTPFAMTNRYMDVKLDNIVWSNMKIKNQDRQIRKILSIIFIILLIIFWTIPVSFVGFISNLNYLTDKLKFLQFIYNLPDAIVGLITGLLPAVILANLTIVPRILIRLFARLSGIATRDAIESYVQKWLFIFQVIQVFLVVTISSSVASVTTKIIQNPPAAPTILAANIPTASNFFLSAIALKSLVVGTMTILQIFALVGFYLPSKLFDNTPRKKWTRYFTLGQLNWGTLYPLFTNYVVITLVYSIIAPLILLVSGLAFLFFYLAFVYRIFYVSEFQYDIGGISYSQAIYQSFTGLYLMELMLTGLFFLAEDQAGVQTAIAEGIFMFILFVFTILVHWTIHIAYKNLITYMPVDVTVEQSMELQMINENTHGKPYVHSSIRAPKPIIWLPNDELGLAADEIQRTQSSGLDLNISMEGAIFNERNKIKISSSPPDYNKSNETDDLITRL